MEPDEESQTEFEPRGWLQPDWALNYPEWVALQVSVLPCAGTVVFQFTYKANCLNNVGGVSVQMLGEVR